VIIWIAERNEEISKKESTYWEKIGNIESNQKEEEHKVI